MDVNTEIGIITIRPLDKCSAYITAPESVTLRGIRYRLSTWAFRGVGTQSSVTADWLIPENKLDRNDKRERNWWIERVWETGQRKPIEASHSAINTIKTVIRRAFLEWAKTNENLFDDADIEALKKKAENLREEIEAKSAELQSLQSQLDDVESKMEQKSAKNGIDNAVSRTCGANAFHLDRDRLLKEAVDITAEPQSELEDAAQDLLTALDDPEASVSRLEAFFADKPELEEIVPIEDDGRTPKHHQV